MLQTAAFARVLWVFGERRDSDFESLVAGRKGSLWPIYIHPGKELVATGILDGAWTNRPAQSVQHARFPSHSVLSPEEKL